MFLSLLHLYYISVTSLFFDSCFCFSRRQSWTTAPSCAIPSIKSYPHPQHTAKTGPRRRPRDQRRCRPPTCLGWTLRAWCCCHVHSPLVFPPFLTLLSPTLPSPPPPPPLCSRGQLSPSSPASTSTPWSDERDSGADDRTPSSGSGAFTTPGMLCSCMLV
jgi:hypothetical protein